MLVVTIRWAREKLLSISAKKSVCSPNCIVLAVPCRVNVIDCSSLSSSSVRVRLRCIELDMLAVNRDSIHRRIVNIKSISLAGDETCEVVVLVECRSTAESIQRPDRDAS